MTTDQGCAALARSLDQLLRHARAARQSVVRLRQEPAGVLADRHLGAAFAEMADTVASTLDDVSERLHRMDKVLNYLDERGPAALRN